MARVYRARLGFLLGAGLIVFVPIGLLDVLDETLQEPLRDVDLGDVAALDVVAAVAAAIAHAAIALGGEVFYAGVVAAAVMAMRAGTDHTLGHLARTLPYGRLIAVDLLLAVAVGVGLILLVVPGLVLLGWFALVAPAVKLEGLGVRAAFRRSRQLVLGNTARVLALVLPILVLQDVAATLVQSGTIGVVGDDFLGDWAAAVLASLIASPPFALAVVVLFLELRGPVSEPG